MPPVCLATEDSLSEAVGYRLLAEVGPDIEVGLTFRKNGFGYLKANIEKFCKVAQRSPLLLITDLDKAKCAASLISKWMGTRAHPDNLVFRVAVREIEAWLLADHVGMKELLVGGASNLPNDPDSLSDPKQVLLKLARKAPRAIKNDLLVEAGAIASQGLGYNERMGEFVRNTWDPKRAVLYSDSLSRTLNRLQQMAEKF
ncbi:MAG: hypothetical protein ACLQFI_13790 [Methylocella sp.]|jgi:hypothetical protein